MRFAYIDSHGNEVPIPSVDALALRIELGAIRPETELYDAQADRWGPAESHEIFHTLSRDLEGGDFMAPPPPVAPPPPEPKHEPEAETEPPAAEPDPPKAAARPRDEPERRDASFGLTLAEPPASESGAGAGAGRSAVDRVPPDLPLLDLDPPDEADAAAAGEADASFDLGELSGGLALERNEPAPSAGAPPGGGFGALDLVQPEADEPPMDFGAPEGLVHGGLELEQPSAQRGPSPAWVEQDGPGGDAVMDFTPVPAPAPAASPGRGAAAGAAGRGAASRAPAAEPSRAGRPKSRPSRPRRVRARSVAGPIVSVVVLAAAGIGAYVAWPILSERLGLELEPPRPPVVIPEIPPNLVAPMRELGDRALAEAFADVDERTRSPDVPAQPPEDWLFGVYLANASRFGEVPAFWNGMRRFMAVLREDEARLFHEHYLEAARAELAGDTVRMLTQRADSGFVAATDAREAVYRRMDELIDAALLLHQFLVENESGIAYQPAALGVSGDPLLEAVPESEEVRASMWDLLEELTGALDALGTLDLVSRQELLDILLDRVRGVAIR